jgi:hypothetical protein
MRSLPVLVVALLAPLVARAEIAVPVPAGWLDLSPGAPEENFRRVPPDFASWIRGQRLTACAFDLAHTENGFTPNFNANPVKGNARITESKLEKAVEEMMAGIRRLAPGARLVEHGIIDVSGVSALRIVYDAEYGGREVRQMAVVVPGVPDSAVVTYSALRSQFAALRATFDAHAASIRGGEEAGFLARLDWGSVLRAAVIGGLIGAVVGAGRAVFKKRAA